MLLFVPFAIVAATQRFKRPWLGTTIAVGVNVAFAFVYGTWLLPLIRAGSQIETELVMLGCTVVAGFLLAGRRFAYVAPIAATIPLFMAAVTLPRTPRDYLEAVELLSFAKQARWVRGLRDLAVDESAWTSLEPRFGIVRRLELRSVYLAEDLLGPQERTALARNVALHPEVFFNPRRLDKHEWFPLPLVASQVPPEGSAMLRASKGDPRVICRLLPERQSWENLAWLVHASNCTANGLYDLKAEYLPGSRDAHTARLDRLFAELGKVANYANTHVLIGQFYKTLRGDEEKLGNPAEVRRIASESGIRPGVWAEWKASYWRERKQELREVLSGDANQIRERLARLPVGTKPECEKTRHLLVDLCVRLGGACRDQDALVKGFAYSKLHWNTLDTPCRGWGMQLWQAQTTIETPENLRQLELWGHELARDPAELTAAR